MRMLAVIVSCVLVLVCGSALAQQQDLIIHDVAMPDLNWGKQEVSIEITNNTDNIKYLAVVVKIAFTESYLKTETTARTNFIFDVREKKTIAPVINVPGNYGRAKVDMEIYDVVDTLDILLPGQRCYHQPIFLNYPTPDAVVQYLRHRIDMPPMMNNHPDFNSEFSRFLLLMLRDGLSTAEIAEMTEATPEFVDEFIQGFVKKQYLIDYSGNMIPSFTVMSIEEGEAARKIADRVSDDMAKYLKENLEDYSDWLASMVEAGTVTGDTNSFLDGSTILHYRYPVVGALFLWYHMGQQFINKKTPLAIFNNGNLCRPRIPSYMYAIEGGGYVQGQHYYDYVTRSPMPVVMFGDTIPKVNCDDKPYSSRRQRVASQIDEAYNPEGFVMDTSLVALAMRVLERSIEPMIEPLRVELKSFSESHGQSSMTRGYRYWFWNMVATLTLEKLVDESVLERRGNGQFRIEGVDNLFGQ